MLHNHDKPKEAVESIRELKRSIYFWAIASGLLVLSSFAVSDPACSSYDDSSE